MLAQAKVDAAAEVEAGRQEGREMVAEAQKVRERMLNDLARRRKAFRQQIERLQAGRDRLLAAYDVVRETLDVATDELQVALPEARLAAETASLRAGDEDVATLEELEREAAVAARRRPPTDADGRRRRGRRPSRRRRPTEPPRRGGRGADEPDAAGPTAGRAGRRRPTPVDDELVEEPGEAEAQDPRPRGRRTPISRVVGRRR